MTQRSPARAETRVPVRVLPTARTLLHRAAFDLLSEITLRLANDAAFELPGDVAASLHATGHVEILARPGTIGSAEPGAAATRPPVEVPALPLASPADLPEWNRVARERLRASSERDPHSGCLVWKGAAEVAGYGAITCNGTRYLTHRLAWLVYRGPIPKGLHVCHSCDNRGCIEITHLFLGTPQDNITDMIRKGRARFYGQARLTEADVADIKRRLADGQSAGGIAKEKSVPYSSVYYIKTNRTWRHVEAAPRVEDKPRSP